MKNLITIFSLLIVTAANAQYFQQRFNLNYAIPSLRNERDNSGIRTRDNYAAMNPALHYYAGIGTSYNNTALPAPDNIADRMRLQLLDNTGTAVIANLGYQFYDAGSIAAFHSYGNSIAEVQNTTGTGGYIAVGAVTNNTITGAATIVGGSDALFTQLDAAGNVVGATRYDINGGTDQANYVRRSVTLVGGAPTWIVCGISRTSATNTDIFVARIFAGGGIVWMFRYNFDPTAGAFNSAINTAKQLVEDGAGNIYVVGTLQDSPAGATGIDGLAFSLTPGGAINWAFNYHLASDDEFQAVRFTSDGNLIVGGFTNFGAVAPATHSMMIVKLTLGGAVIAPFPNILRAAVGATIYTSKCYDIIEVKTSTGAVEYYLSGPIIPGAIYEMMYRTNAIGLGISWHTYQRMNYNIGFGLDNVNTAANAGIAYFSSMRNPNNPGFSDSHIMKLNYTGQTCNFCGIRQPSNLQVNMQPIQCNRMLWQVNQPRPLTSQVFKYQNVLICNVPVVACLNANKPASVMEASDASVKTPAAVASVKVFPNPAKNNISVQFNTVPAGNYNLSIVDMQGKTVKVISNYYNNGASVKNIDVSALTPGIYLLSAAKGDLVLQQKFVKQ